MTQEHLNFTKRPYERKGWGAAIEGWGEEVAERAKQFYENGIRQNLKSAVGLGCKK